MIHDRDALVLLQVSLRYRLQLQLVTYFFSRQLVSFVCALIQRQNVIYVIIPL